MNNSITYTNYHQEHYNPKIHMLHNIGEKSSTSCTYLNQVSLVIRCVYTMSLLHLSILMLMFVNTHTHTHTHHQHIHI